MSGYESGGNQEKQSGLPPLEMLSDAVTGKFGAYPKDVNIDSTQPDRTFEILELETVTLWREMLTYGRLGAPSIVYLRTNLSGKKIWAEMITFNNAGYWEYVISDKNSSSHHQTGDRVRPFQIGVFYVKVLKERPREPDRQADSPNIWENLDEL